MKHKIPFLLAVLFLVTLACQSTSNSPAGNQGVSNQTPELSSQSIATELPSELTDAFGVPMALIPEGEFTMGENADDVVIECEKYRSDCLLDSFTDEEPLHQVFLDTYYIDIYEVTNAAFKACVDAGACTPPQDTSSNDRSIYYGNSQFDDYPVINVDWNQAQTYCEWRGGSLPTEAQWEKAARGMDDRMYPWGDTFDGTKLNFCDKNCSSSGTDSDDGYADTSPVGNYPNGISPYGVYDMAGNVWEWVGDWYDSAYYQNSPRSNPVGPSSGEYRLLRGGSWGSEAFGAHVSNRNWASPEIIQNYFGFRCAISASDISQQSEIVAQNQEANTQLPAYALPDYLYLSDAYKITKHDDGSIEFYSNMSFAEIEKYYLQELPRYGYSDGVVHYGEPAEGCDELIFEGDPSGKALVITNCIIFSTEEHWVSIGLVDK